MGQVNSESVFVADLLLDVDQMTSFWGSNCRHDCWSPINETGKLVRV